MKAVGQLLAVAGRYFPGANNLVVLGIDENAVAQWLVNEGPAGIGDPADPNIYPHIYAAIPVSAVVAAVPLVSGDNGRFVWPVDFPNARPQPIERK
jgi:uncharacterized protein (DUF952 family)